jgi:hypothetical protein
MRRSLPMPLNASSIFLFFCVLGAACPGSHPSACVKYARPCEHVGSLGLLRTPPVNQTLCYLQLNSMRALHNFLRRATHTPLCHCRSHLYMCRKNIFHLLRSWLGSQSGQAAIHVLCNTNTFQKYKSTPWIFIKLYQFILNQIAQYTKTVQQNQQNIINIDTHYLKKW